jgi:hypothetical protein
VAQHQGRQGEWPTNRDPTATFVTPDGYLRSPGRSLAGPLRTGTEPRVGPKGSAGNGASDFGTDQLDPAKGRFDPIGTSTTRDPAPPQSEFISRRR